VACEQSRKEAGKQPAWTRTEVYGAWMRGQPTDCF
jgi:hypothetical protein